MTEDADGPLIPVPIPALSALLFNLQKQKGSPLTEAEVLEIRDKAVCMEEKRGYADIDPQHAWEDWNLLMRSIGPSL